MTADRLGCTPSQTVGPFLHIALAREGAELVVPPDAPDAIVVSGQVLDGDGVPVTDALVETWQADAAGRFAHPDDPRGAAPPTPEGFRGWGRCPTDASGRYRIVTVKPGALPAPGGRTEAPHIDVSVFARGLLDRLVTRLYFPDEPEANHADPVLQGLPDQFRAGLVAVPEPDGLRFDIWLQGEREITFFDV